jgi:hypothetical protein
LAGLLLAVSCATTWAADPTFGPEFTFFAPLRKGGKLVGIDASIAPRRSQAAMAQFFELLCRQRGDCKLSRERGKWFRGKDHVITFDDGFWIRLAVDGPVVEVQTRASTLGFFERNRERLEGIFAAAANSGLKPGAGGGHLHMGLQSAFESKPTLFRNYVVDVFNHPELGRGIFGSSTSFNVELPGLQGDGVQESFQAVLADFDGGKLRTAEELAYAIETRVYLRSNVYKGGGPLKRRFWNLKQQGLNLRRVRVFRYEPDKQTLESRNRRAQRSVDEFLDQIRLQKARVDFLEKLDGRLLYDPMKVSPEIGNQANLDHFYTYVMESGEDWSRYSGYLPQDFEGPGALRSQPVPWLTPSLAPTEVAPHTEATRKGMAPVARKIGCARRWLSRFLSIGRPI